MFDVPDAYLDPGVAASYDDDVADRFDPAVLGPTVEVLARLAGDGPAVEFAIGTGRVAVALAAHGVPVSGMDLSEPMLARLVQKDPDRTVSAVVGDMTTMVLGEDFALAYLVFNSIMNARTQDAQVACFVNAARHLRPGGRFVVEVGVPGLASLPPGERFRPFDVSPEHLGIDEYVDPVAQILVSHHYRIQADGTVRQSSQPFRYVWPSELDLMARLAGMELESRWADWNGSPFTGESSDHVSVWVRR